MPRTKPVDVQRTAKQWRVRVETVETVAMIANEVGMFEGAVIDRAVQLLREDPFFKELLNRPIEAESEVELAS